MTRSDVSVDFVRPEKWERLTKTWQQTALEDIAAGAICVADSKKAPFQVMEGPLTA